MITKRMRWIWGNRSKVFLLYMRHNYYKSNGIKQIFNVIKHYRGMRNKPVEFHAVPYAIFLEPTIRCNLKCPFCDFTGRNRHIPDLSLDNFKIILKKLPLLAHIHLQGMGEPLLNKQFLEMVRFATHQGVTVDTTTNATLITEEMAEGLVGSGLNQLFISIDGATAKTYESIRIEASFETVMKNLEFLSQLNIKRRKPLRLVLWFVGTQNNIHELPQLIDLAARLKISVVYADATHDWGRQAVKINMERIVLQEDSALSVELARKYVDIAVKKATKLGILLEINPLLSDVINGAQTRSCSFPWWSFYITVEGDVTPCCLRPDPRVVNYGNIFRQAFNTIWNSSGYRHLREGLKTGNPPEFCIGCWALGTKGK